MHASRSMLIVVLAGVLSLVVDPLRAQTRQPFPEKPVRLVAGAFGSPSDMLARTLGPKLSEAWGKPVLVENAPAARGPCRP